LSFLSSHSSTSFLLFVVDVSVINLLLLLAR
jgi:hypothetical protein